MMGPMGGMPGTTPSTGTTGASTTTTPSTTASTTPPSFPPNALSQMMQALATDSPASGQTQVINRFLFSGPSPFYS